MTERLGGPLVRLSLVMVLGAMMSLIDATIVAVAVPHLATDLGVPLREVEWVSTAYLVAMAAATSCSGWAVQRFGARTVWLAAVAGFTAASVLAACAWSLPSLVGFRVLQGIGGGLLEPVLFVVLPRAAGHARVGRMLAVVSAGITVGPVVGPVLGGAILAVADWRWIFLVNLPIGLVVLATSWRLVPRQDAADVGGTLDVRGLLLLPTGVAALLYGLSQSARPGGGRGDVVLATALGIALLVAYVRHAARRGPSALVDLRPLRSPATAVAIGVMALLGATIYGLNFALPQLSVAVLGFSSAAIGVPVTAYALGTLVGMPLASGLSDGLGTRRLVVPGAVLVAVGLAVLATIGASLPTAVLLAVLMVVGFAFGLIGAPTVAAIYRVTPHDLVPSATATMFVANQLGGALGIAVLALLVDRGTGHGAQPLWLFVLAALAIGALAVRLPGRPAPVPVPVG